MSDRMLYIGGGIAVTAALALAIYMRPLPDEAVPDSAPVADAAAPTASDPAASQDAAAAVAAAPADRAPVGAPRLTDLRVEADGLALISGQSAPGAEVVILLDGVEIDRVMADGAGSFLSFPQLPPSERPRVLTFTAEFAGRSQPGEEAFAIAPFGSPEVDLASVEPDAAVEGEPGMEGSAVAVEEPAPPQSAVPAVPEDAIPLAPEDPALAETAVPTEDAEAETQAATDQAPVDPGAPAVLAISEAGVRVLTAPDAPAPEVMSTVALDTITYDGTGDVLLAGRAANTGFLRVYVDNSPVTALAVDAATGWEVALPEVDTGVYTLRIDEVSEAGEVLSRIETPFLREDPALVEEAFEQAPEQGAALSVAMRTVQPGNTLWAIAEERYGAGILYVQVFAANADRIRNPDLIYPGQVFELPELGQ